MEEEGLIFIMSSRGSQGPSANSHLFFGASVIVDDDGGGGGGYESEIEIADKR